MVEKKSSTKKNIALKALNLLGDINRLKILCFIFDKKNICVSEISKKMGLSVANTSHHLRALSDSELLIPVRFGKRVCYRFSDSQFADDLKKFICKYK